MKTILLILLTTLLSSFNFAYANERKNCEAPILKTGEYQLNGRDGYVCGVRIGHGENETLVAIYFSTSEFACKVNLPSLSFEKQVNEFGVYLNSTKSHRIIVLNERSFIIEGVQTNPLLYVRRGF
jgi:hypothetical protein